MVSQTKWVSEMFLQKIRETSNPHVTIFRPGTIGSDSITGHSNLVDINNRIIQAIVTLRVYPMIEDVLEMFPVNEIAAQMIQILCNPVFGEVFHFTNPKSPTLKFIGETISSYFPELNIQPVTYKVWQEKLLGTVKAEVHLLPKKLLT